MRLLSSRLFYQIVCVIISISLVECQQYHSTSGYFKRDLADISCDVSSRISQEPLLTVTEDCTASNSFETFVLKSGKKINFKKPLNGKISVKFPNGPNKHMVVNDRLKLKKCIQIRADLFTDTAEVSGHFVDNYLQNQAIISLANGTSILVKLDDTIGRIVGFQKHFGTKGLQGLSHWNEGHAIWNKNMTDLFVFSQPINNKHLSTFGFDTFILCQFISQHAAWNCEDVEKSQLYFRDGFPIPKPSLQVIKEVSFNINTKTMIKDTITETNNRKTVCETKNSLNSWLGAIQYDNPIFIYDAELKRQSMTTLNVGKLELDLPELKSQPHLHPQFVKIYHNGVQVFSGALEYNPETGKAIIDVTKNNAMFSQALEQGSGFLPFHFEVSSEERFTVDSIPGSLIIKGHLCMTGKLCGLVRKFGQIPRAPDFPCMDVVHHKLSFVGYLDPKTGNPTGPSYRLLVGNSMLYNENYQTLAYIYMDTKTAVVGEFDSFGLLIKGQKVRVKSSTCNDNGMLVTQFTLPIEPETFYAYKPPTKEEFGDQPQVPDEIAVDFVEVRQISEFMGDGIFAKVDIEPGIIIMQYGGVRTAANEEFSKERQVPQTPYLQNMMCNAKVDIPIGFIDTQKYNGTLAHKANHNFYNNVDTGISIDSLRYGLICSHQTIRPIKAGEEIFSDYGYTIAFKLTRTRGIEWYYDEWREFKAKYPDHLKVKQLTKIINKHIII